jgi:xylulokinase
MLFLGLDIGTSSIKAAVIDGHSGQTLAAAQYPDSENPIASAQPGWAEQSPELWWDCVVRAINRCVASGKFDARDIAAVGIAYQMHGLVMMDRFGQVLRPSIIWCDSRAIHQGQQAFEALGADFCLSHLLNSPGNFTAAKLAWVKQHEPRLYGSLYQMMLPGDYIAYRLTGQVTTTPSALSEGILWDFQSQSPSQELLKYFGFPANILPDIRPVFGEHGQLSSSVATLLGLRAGIPVSYKAGDQPNNALSLNVLSPGEVAATAGTSGVVYAVTDQANYDPASRVNTFAHVNHRPDMAQNRLGILLCINGTGSLNRWMRQQISGNASYAQMNALAASVPAGSEGLLTLPFGNGAERVLGNRQLGAQWRGIDFNRHTLGHLLRSGQEGIAFSLRYGLDLMAQLGTQPSVIRAGWANLFLSEVFTQTLVNVTGVPIELYDTDGARGAALGAGIGLGFFSQPEEAFGSMQKQREVLPETAVQASLQEAYTAWEKALNEGLH